MMTIYLYIRSKYVTHCILVIFYEIRFIRCRTMCTIILCLTSAIMINTGLRGMKLVRTCSYANILRETSSMLLKLVSRIWMTSFCKSICHHRWCIKSNQIRSIPFSSVTLPFHTDCHWHLNKIRMTHKIMNLMNNKYSFSNLDVVEIILAAC